MMHFPAFLTGLGWPEILLILALVLVLFGPKRLPEIAEAMGKSIRKFKSATNEATRDVKRYIVHGHDPPEVLRQVFNVNHCPPLPSVGCQVSWAIKSWF